MIPQMRYIKISFNSSMVRLGVAGATGISAAVKKFQFQYGSIGRT